MEKEQLQSLLTITSAIVSLTFTAILVNNPMIIVMGILIALNFY